MIPRCGCCGYPTLYLKRDGDRCGYCEKHPPGATCASEWKALTRGMKL